MCEQLPIFIVGLPIISGIAHFLTRATFSLCCMCPCAYAASDADNVLRIYRNRPDRNVTPARELAKTFCKKNVENERIHVHALIIFA